MDKKLLVSSTPHIRAVDSIERTMKDVIIALIPAAVAGIVFFGARALMLIIISIVSCVLFEYGFQKLLKRDVTIKDLSAAVTGLLLAMNLPSAVPWWMPILGGFFAIVVVKQLYGGLGQNFMNPALGARAFLLLSFPQEMTTWVEPLHNQLSFKVDAIASVTPLEVLAKGVEPGNSDIMNAFLGNISGSLGETCAILLIIGGLYLIYRKVISWRIPCTYILTVFILSFLMGKNGIYEILIGGIMLGSIYMATDYSSSPVTPNGQLVMGIGCGFLTALLRKYSTSVEVVSFAILFMNLLVPLIEKFTKPRVFGTVRSDKNVGVN